VRAVAVARVRRAVAVACTRARICIHPRTPVSHNTHTTTQRHTTNDDNTKKTRPARNLYAAAGFAAVYYPFGAGCVHALPTTLATYLVMWLIPRKCGTLAWLINFPYLLVL
jgi:hypothetical protein